MWLCRAQYELTPVPLLLLLLLQVLRMMDHMRRHTGDITCADWSHDASLVATGSNDRTVRVWDLETGKLEGLLKHPAEVVSLFFLKPYPYLLSADASGNVFVWGTRNSNCKNSLVFAWSQVRHSS